jgi:hypothetical protein
VIEGVKYIGFKGMRSFYKTRYELKMNINKYLSVGLKISLLFYEEAKDYY